MVPQELLELDVKELTLNNLNWMISLSALPCQDFQPRRAPVIVAAIPCIIAFSLGAKLKCGIIIQASTFSISLSFPPPSSSLKNLSVLFALTGSIIGDALHCARAAAAQSPSQFIRADCAARLPSPTVAKRRDLACSVEEDSWQKWFYSNIMHACSYIIPRSFLPLSVGEIISTLPGATTFTSCCTNLGNSKFTSFHCLQCIS